MADAVAPIGYTAGTTFLWNTKGQVISAAALLPFLGVILVGLRFYVRIKHKAGLGADDWLSIPALLLATGAGVCLMIGVGKDVIAHTTAPNPDPSPDAQLYQITPAQELVEKIEFIFTLSLILAYGCTKLSVIYFYRRIFVKGTSSRFNSVTKVSIVVVILWTVTFVLCRIFGCGIHVDYQWGPLSSESHCFTGFSWFNGLYVSDFLIDFLVLILPFPIIVRLRMSTTRKLNVIAVLMLGAMSFCAAIVRMVFSFQITAIGLARKTDVDEVLTTLLYWGMVEVGLSLIAICLPPLYIIFARNSVQSVIARVRSAISLRSLRSNESRTLKKSYENVDNSSKISYKQPLKQPVENSSHVYTTYEMDEMITLPPPAGAIRVKSDLSQSEMMV